MYVSFSVTVTKIDDSTTSDNTNKPLVRTLR